MLKGMGVGAIVKLVLAVMVASLFVSMTTIGSLGQALQQSFTNIDSATDFTVEVDDEESLSDLAMFVRDRAVGCEEVEARNSGERLDDDDRVEAEGYPGLSEDQRLGQRPSCYGGSSTVLREGALGSLNPFGGPEDNYMPGLYSREQFKVTEIIDFQENRDTYWLDRNIAGVSGKNYETHIVRSEEDRAFTNYQGTGRNYVIFFEEGAAENRSNDLIENYDPIDLPPGISTYDDRGFSDRVWRKSSGEDSDYADLGENYISLDRQFNDNNEVPFEFILCPGDEGYIQMNRGTPYNDGLSNRENSENYYPHIVIEEVEQDSCGELAGRGQLAPPEEPHQGRLLHITGDTAKEFPHVRKPGTWGTKNLAFDFFRLNENRRREQNRIVWGDTVDIGFEEEYSESCIIGMFDQGNLAVDSTGEIRLNQGTRIPYDGSFPSRESTDILVSSLGDKSDRNAPPRPSSKDLYDSYVNEGFTGEDWGSSGINNKILYESGGERRFELYGDLLCAPHNNNQQFENNHGQWVMCSSKHDGETRTVNQQSWTCDSNSGRWEQENEGPELEPAPETITVNWDDTSSNSEDWLQASDDTFTINTEEVSDNIYMDWESALPNTWEEVSVTATPDRRGHLRIAGQGPDFYQSYPYFYFGGEGYTGESENIYLNDYGDNFENDFEPLTGYEPDETYTFTFNRVENSLEVKENGETVWENSDLEAFNFPRLRLWHTDDNEDTNTTIENIEVIYPQPVENNGNEPTCEEGEYECSSGKCVDEPSKCGGL